MALPNKSRVIEFLTAYPNGAPVWKLAEYLNSRPDSAIQTLRIMGARGEVLMVKEEKTRADSVWMLAKTSKVVTPPIFRAMEILGAMQATARANQLQPEFAE